MDYHEALGILGIDEKTDRESARRAYLRIIKHHNPERDPKGFQRLREAYELVDAWLSYDDEDRDHLSSENMALWRCASRNDQEAEEIEPSIPSEEQDDGSTSTEDGFEDDEGYSHEDFWPQFSGLIRHKQYEQAVLAVEHYLSTDNSWVNSHELLRAVIMMHRNGAAQESRRLLKTMENRINHAAEGIIALPETSIATLMLTQEFIKTDLPEPVRVAIADALLEADPDLAIDKLRDWAKAHMLDGSKAARHLLYFAPNLSKIYGEVLDQHGQLAEQNQPVEKEPDSWSSWIWFLATFIALSSAVRLCENKKSYTPKYTPLPESFNMPDRSPSSDVPYADSEAYHLFLTICYSDSPHDSAKHTMYALRISRALGQSQCNLAKALLEKCVCYEQNRAKMCNMNHEAYLKLLNKVEKCLKQKEDLSVPPESKQDKPKKGKNRERSRGKISDGTTNPGN